MKKQNILLIVAILVVIIVVGVCVILFDPKIAAGLGLKHASQQGTTSTTQGRFGVMGGVGGMRGGFVSGSIEVLNDDGFTLTLQDGTTKNVLLSATTTIENYTSASSTPTTITSDQLSVGEQVSVIGSPNDDSSVTARTVRTGVLPVRYH